MKPDSDQLRTLLDDVMPPAGRQCGPDRAALLDLVRHERRRRQHRRIALSTTALLVLSALLTMLLQRPAGDEMPPVAMQHAASAPPPPPSRAEGLHQINDLQLLDLLKDTPAALMEWPNGERTLLVWGK